MIQDEIKLKLIEFIPKQVVSILIANGHLIHLGGELDWENVVVSDKTSALLKIIENKKDKYENLIKELMEIFPKNQVDSKGSITKRFNSWLNKTNLKTFTEEEVLDAAREWVNDKGSTFCGRLFYFFYKEENKNYISRLENLIELNREASINKVEIKASNSDIDWDDIK